MYHRINPCVFVFRKENEDTGIFLWKREVSLEKEPEVRQGKEELDRMVSVRKRR